jgi:membrane protease YdiL (CAAX protease family)
MEAFEMSTPIPYLDCIILAAAVYPSGFSHSLFRSWKGTPREVSSAFLFVLALPFVFVVVALAAVYPQVFAFRGASGPMFAAAVLLVPVALLMEYCVHALESYRLTGSFPRGIAVQRFWRRRLSPTDHLLLMLVVVGEEIFYRGFWLAILLGSFSFPSWVAVGVSSLAYGVNHLAFGRGSVISKTVVGILYSSLYLFGGKSLWLPIVSHGLQNVTLLMLAKKRHA